MLSATLNSLRCPACQKELTLAERETVALAGGLKDVVSGELKCAGCKGKYPILGGVAVLVEDVRGYLLTHVKGISRLIVDSDIPKEYLKDYRRAKAEIEVEHIEEDLEAERVVSLYLMNHYLRVGKKGSPTWWKPDHGTASPLIDELVRKYWDHGPFAQISKWLEKRDREDAVIELGCGVGGLFAEIQDHCEKYLGVDGSFASIALARHLVLGAKYSQFIRVPRDLLQGPVSADAGLAPGKADGRADFIVGDLENLPVAMGEWGVSIALNAIDMLPEPALLPRLQHDLAENEGIAIQSCPYIWHAEISSRLRQILPKGIKDSASAVEWLYERAGLKLKERADHVPWLFYKHARQLEVYSVHLMLVALH